MRKTVFRIDKMDCPSEEQMIRMKLDGLPEVKSLRFDIPGRTLEAYHMGDVDHIAGALDALRLDSTVVSTKTIDETVTEDDDHAQRRVLLQVLFINLFFFVLEMLAGFVSGSLGLVADSLDMLADSIVYGLSLLAVGRATLHKKRVAGVAGSFQMVLAALGFMEVVRRFLGRGEAPDFRTMVIVSILALAGNAACLFLLQKSKSREAHMQASVIFTSTDVIANLGVIVAGVLVYFTTSKLPDLAVGLIVFFLVGRGALRILALSRT